ncbi:MAG: chromophore lyase CpcT/CpeT [Planctomycetota bacterium]
MFTALVLAGCSSDNVVTRTAGSVSRAITGAASEDDLARAASWLEGSFTSAEQAERDELYFEVNLHHARIWPQRDDGTWLYVEQALAANPDSPYRQRVYRVWLRPDGVIESAVYELPEPSRFVGAWRDPGSLDSLSPISLEKRDGCAVVFIDIGDEAMTGATVGTACTSTLRSASYATSEVTITADGITSWDRGFDEAGEQVWGAEAGPYVFRRIDR